MNLAPIILFVYNRPGHTKKTVDALKLNKLASESLLFIFSDGNKAETDNKSVDIVRNYISNISGFKEIKIILREKNIGLADSVISGVTEVIKNYGKAIVLEDDIVTSLYFLKFMNEALDFYEADKRIYSISGYNFPIKIPNSYKHKIYISPRPSSWGWATWKDRWERVDWKVLDFNDFVQNKKLLEKFNIGGDDLLPMLKKQLAGKINSWAIRWAYAHSKNDSFCLYPVDSFLENIGADNSGTHTKKTNKFNVKVNQEEYLQYLIKNIDTNLDIQNTLKIFFSKKNLFKRLLNIISISK